MNSGHSHTEAYKPSVDVDERTRCAWNESARTYDSLYGHGIHGPSELKAWQALVRRITPASNTPLKVLDVGTGTGFLALLFAEMGHSVTAVDYSEEMLLAAREKAEELGVALDVVHSSAELENLPSQKYDLITCRHLLWALEWPEGTLREWRRRLHGGGKIIAIEQLRLAVSRPRQWARDAADTLNPLFGTGDAHSGTFPDLPRYRQPLKHISDAEPALNALRRAGFASAQSERLTWLDDVERRAMPPLERWGRRWNRYLLEAWNTSAD